MALSWPTTLHPSVFQLKSASITFLLEIDSILARARDWQSCQSCLFCFVPYKSTKCIANRGTWFMEMYWMCRDGKWLKMVGDWQASTKKMLQFQEGNNLNKSRGNWPQKGYGSKLYKYVPSILPRPCHQLHIVPWPTIKTRPNCNCFLSQFFVKSTFLQSGVRLAELYWEAVRWR